MRRLVLALLLIAGTSAILLLSDSQNRKHNEEQRQARVFIIEYNRVLDVEEAEAGVLDGLRHGGLREGTDYTVEVLNAQGDVATLNSLIDAAAGQRADMLITTSTPSLQAAARKFKKAIIFTYVASPVAAGVGRTNEDHLPNVTGVYGLAPYSEMIDLIREVLPHARNLGLVYVPAEPNMIFHMRNLEKAAAQAGLRVTATSADTTAEVSDAASALCMRKIDAICQVPGNLTAASFPTIASAARQARIPVFAFQSSQARTGAAIVLARDNFDAGQQAGVLATRVLHGESPAAIPFGEFKGIRLIVNLSAAREQGLTVPRSILEHAEETLP
ncbi:MAG: ABC transporter substrate-binding protein [Acidobacteria bacterium]|nr:MAG: ABC transporter substrate-binding protein [Acidobacteriota bacterium]